jgi:hypothetical protein
MGKKKTKTTSTNTYGWQQNPGSADQDAYRASINSAYDTPDASIPFAFNNARESVKNRYSNPFGADYSPEVADAARYSGMNELNQAQGQAVREDAFNRKQGKTAALGGLAQMTGPQLVQTGGTQNTTQSNGIMGVLGPIMQAGASLGGAALM